MLGLVLRLGFRVGIGITVRILVRIIIHIQKVKKNRLTPQTYDLPELGFVKKDMNV